MHEKTENAFREIGSAANWVTDTMERAVGSIMSDSKQLGSVLLDKLLRGASWAGKKAEEFRARRPG